MSRFQPPMGRHCDFFDGFGVSFLSRVRSCAGCYVVTDEFDNVIYIGSSENLNSHLLAHKKLQCWRYFKYNFVTIPHKNELSARVHANYLLFQCERVVKERTKCNQIYPRGGCSNLDYGNLYPSWSGVLAELEGKKCKMCKLR